MGLFGGSTEAELAEAARRSAQWCAAAPCPDHGHADLVLGILRCDVRPMFDPQSEQEICRLLREPLNRTISVACGLCGRLTATFVVPRTRPH